MRGTTVGERPGPPRQEAAFPIASPDGVSSVGAALVIQPIGMRPSTAFLLATGRGSVQPGLLVAASRSSAPPRGPALILASLNVFFRDLAQILPPFLMVASTSRRSSIPSRWSRASPRPSSRESAARPRRALPRGAVRSAASAFRPRRRPGIGGLAVVGFSGSGCSGGAARHSPTFSKISFIARRPKVRGIRALQEFP